MKEASSVLPVVALQAHDYLFSSSNSLFVGSTLNRKRKGKGKEEERKRKERGRGEEKERKEWSKRKVKGCT